MFYKYSKRRSTNYINLDQVEQVSYYLTDDEQGNVVKELAIYFTSGRIYKERTKAEEIYKNLKKALDTYIWDSVHFQESENTYLMNKNITKFPHQKARHINSANKNSIKDPSKNNSNDNNK